MRPILLAGRPLRVGGMALALTDPGLPTSLTLSDFAGVSVGTDGIRVQHVMQRAPGSTTRDVPVLFTYSGAAPTSVEAKVVKRQTGSTVMDWTALTGLSVSGASGTGVLPAVPQGSDYLLQIREGTTRPSSGALFSAGAQPWGIGVRVWAAGQSNMNNMLAGGLNVHPVPGYPAGEEAAWLAGADGATPGYPGAILDRAGFHQPTNGNSVWGPSGSGDSAQNTRTDDVFLQLRLLTAGLKAKYGYDVPVALIPYAVNANDIASFTGPGGVNFTSIINGSGHDAVARTFGLSTPLPWNTGDFEVFLFHQGEANAGDSQTTYQSELTVLFSGLLSYVAQFGRDATTFNFLPMVIGTLDASVGAGVENIRSAQQAWVVQARAEGKTGVQLGGTTIDLTRVPTDGSTPDSYHFTQPNVQRRGAKRMVQSVLAALRAADYGARGPTLGTPTRTGDVIAFPVSHDGGTELQTPGTGPITGWAVNSLADFSGTAIPPAVSISGNNVLLTLPAGTSYPVSIKYLGEQIGTAASSSPDISNLIYDNAVYPRRKGQSGSDADTEPLGFPLLPTIGSVSVT